MSETKFDFDDILITPSVISTISSRKKVNPYRNGMLPIFTAPMDTVINLNTIDVFKQSKIIPIIPRTEVLHEQNSQYYAEHFVAVGLDEAMVLIDMDDDGFNSFNINHILIDVANGHMKTISKLVNKLKEKKPNIEIMIGNIANPKTYTWYAKNTNVDYIRIGIGMGSGCLTSKNSSIGYPMGSLIHEINKEKQKLIKQGNNNIPKIVADGGLKDYSDIIKALYLGADYVMLGGIFNKALESCSPTYKKNIFGYLIESKNPTNDFNKGIKLYKNFRGMSTKEAQKAMGKTTLKTSEGVVRTNEVKYTLSGWIDNFESYLRSAMSYTNSETLDNFIGGNNYSIISNFSYNRFNK